MAEARQLKSREYYTNVIAHDQTVQNAPSYHHRNTNTFRSDALNQQPARAPVVQSRTHENIFNPKPMASHVTRASYQDSNPLNVNQRVTERTIQNEKAMSPDPVLNTRDTNTFKSAVFHGAAGCGNQKRDQDTFKSTVFGSATPNPINRKKLGGESKGVPVLFGRDRLDYRVSSVNYDISQAEGPHYQEQNAPQTKE